MNFHLRLMKINKPVKPFHVLINGKIQVLDRHQGHIYTTIICPAPDAYTKSAVVKVRSKQMIGSKDEEVKNLQCLIGGYTKRSYQGENGTIIPVEITLDVIE